MAKTTTRRKLIMFLAMNISLTTSGRDKNAIGEPYKANNRYLAFPETKESQKYLGAFARQRSGAGSWQIIEKVSLLLINCVINPKTPNKKEFITPDKKLRVKLRRL